MAHSDERRERTGYEAAMIRYYSRAESAIGYRLFLGGARHVCYYPEGLKTWHLRRGLREMEDLVGHRLALDPKSRVLDAGCGLGKVARHLAENFGHEVTGIDLLSSNIEGARRLAKRSPARERMQFTEMSYAVIDAADGSFDGVYTVESLVHAEDLQAVLHEFHRVLRVGGRLAIFEFSRAPDEELSAAARSAFDALNESDEMPGFQQITHLMLPTLMEEAGFSITSRENIIENAYPWLQLIARIGSVPYALGRMLHLDKLMVSSLSAINIWKFRVKSAYNVIVAEKRAG